MLDQLACTASPAETDFEPSVLVAKEPVSAAGAELPEWSNPAVSKSAYPAELFDTCCIPRIPRRVAIFGSLGCCRISIEFSSFF
jgi:hypothetical protein